MKGTNRDRTFTVQSPTDVFLMTHSKTATSVGLCLANDRIYIKRPWLQIFVSRPIHSSTMGDMPEFTLDLVLWDSPPRYPASSTGLVAEGDFPLCEGWTPRAGSH